MFHIRKTVKESSPFRNTEFLHVASLSLAIISQYSLPSYLALLLSLVLPALLAASPPISRPPCPLPATLPKQPGQDEVPDPCGRGLRLSGSRRGNPPKSGNWQTTGAARGCFRVMPCQRSEKKGQRQKVDFFLWNVKDTRANWWFWLFFLTTFAILVCF